MGSSPIVDSVISLFIMIVVGAYSTRKGVITTKTKEGLVNVLIEIALPFMIFSSFIFNYDESIGANVLRTFFYSASAYVITIVVSWLLTAPVKGPKKTVLHFANVFSNTGYVGFPILNAIYGSEGVVYGSIFNMFFVVLVWTYGIILYRGVIGENVKEELRKVLLNRSIIAVVLGLMVMFFDIKLPSAVVAGAKSLGGLTGPLSMLIIGAILSEVRIADHLKDWTVYYGVVSKLIVIPFIIYLCALTLGYASMMVNTVIILTAMPASTMTSILAERYRGAGDYAAVIVSLTTLLSLVSVTILLQILR